MSHYSLFASVADKDTQVKPFAIDLEAMAPIGLDEDAWNAFRGTRVDERGNIEMDEYLDNYDEDATVTFMRVLSERIIKGRIVVSITPEGESIGTIFVLEKDGFVRFDNCEGLDRLNFDNAYCYGPTGELVARTLIHEAVRVLQQRINELLSIDLQLSHEAA